MKNKSRKILIIGLDGATWNVFDDFVLARHMPNLAELKSKGFSGVLHSTEPPITPAAWTTFITGCQPCRHGIIGWHEYSCKEDRLKITSSNSCLVPNIWQELSNQGYTIASINVPWTYPCKKVNGIIVAGYGCPGPKSQLTYPNSFKRELLSNIPDYEIVATWDKSANYTLQQLNNNMDRVDRSFKQRVEAAKLVSRKVDWDIMMVQFHDTDLIEHHIWPYLDKNTRDQYPLQRDRAFESFRKLDQAIGELLDLAATDKLMTLVVSDHGLRRKTAKVRPNVMLARWGYLKTKNALKHTVQKRLRKLSSVVRLSQGKEKGLKQSKDYDFDWANSKAMVIDTAINGHLFINLKGRQPNGIVRQDNEYRKILQDLRKRFEQAVNPNTKELLFSKVGTPAEVYNFTDADKTEFGDLVVVPKLGIELVLSGARNGEYLQTSTNDSLGGTHSYQGIYLFSGDGIKPATDVPTHIVNMAPTLYAALSARLPQYMDGKVLEELFHEKISIEYQTGKIHASQDKENQNLSAEEEAEITKRLSALGYVE